MAIAVSVHSFSFFFQAEDGIRDRNVTGVQTCALPIYAGFQFLTVGPREELETCMMLMRRHGFRHIPICDGRSEERRVGKELRCGGVGGRCKEKVYGE